jgi:hypothetical protein
MTRLAIVAPVETVKTKVIELNKPFIEGFKYIVKTEGIKGVYQGVSFGTAIGFVLEMKKIVVCGSISFCGVFTGCSHSLETGYQPRISVHVVQ